MAWSCGLQFRVRTGPDRGSTYPIDSPVVKIGRARHPGDRQEGWVRVADDTVSRLHCELFWQEDRKSFRLLHRSTTNSTYLNGEIVEDAELFDGDILEIGSIALELQKADLRWSQADDKAVKEWPQRPESGGVPASKPKVAEGPAAKVIPGATVAAIAPGAGLKITIGPKQLHQFVTHEDEVYPLKDNRIRFGCAVDPEDDPDSNEPKKKPHFDVHYSLDGKGLEFSYYNLVLRYDELYQGYKAVRMGPKAQEISISREMGGLTWRSTFPEGTEVALVPGDVLLMGNIELTYQKAEKSKSEG
jgi:pSer/pThr/pTyr-binding forkhead associated (FHA) protein